VIAAAIPDAMLLPTDECFAQEVPEPILKMNMFYCKNWPCDIVIKYSLN
jgi:hypothetical protein